MYLTCARTPGVSTPAGSSFIFVPVMSAAPLLLLAGVMPEGAGGGELAELVPDHRLGDVHGHVLAPVVHGDGVADHVGDDRGAARPRLDDPLLVAGVEVVDLLQQVIVDEGALLQAARHAISTFSIRACDGDGR